MTNPTFRIVRQIITNGQDVYADINRTSYVADINGDWIEKDYNNGTLSYKMAVDCNQSAVAKLRIAE